MAEVNVYSENGEIIATVKYNNNLDIWNGHNWQSGGPGLHKGLTRLEDGRYVLIHGTQWQGEQDHAEIITPKEAVQQILRSGDLDLLDEYNLRELYEEKILSERKTTVSKSVKVTREVHDMLTEIAEKNESYNDVILRLLKQK